MPSEFLDFARDVGAVTLTITVLAYFLVQLLGIAKSTHEDYSELLEKVFALEKKLTICETALATEKGDKALVLVQQAKDYAVENLLDDTRQDGLVMERQASEIGELKTLVKTLESQLARRNHDILESDKELSEKSED